MRVIRSKHTLLGLLLAAITAAPAAFADVVKVTGLGSQQGEFCQLDRALIFEDPDGPPALRCGPHRGRC